MPLQVDCDVHIDGRGTAPLLPYLDDHWREAVVTRGIDAMDLTSYPPRRPFSARPEWRGPDGIPGGDLDTVRGMLDRFGTDIAVLNCLHGAQAMFSEDLGGALVGAVNSWIAAEWLDREPRLRASIVVHARNPDIAVAEIEKRAADPRFVQVLLMAGSHELLGRRSWWPIYEAAERHRLPIGVHAGSLGHRPPTPNGWPATTAEEYAQQTLTCQQQMLSMIAEGVFTKFPTLTVVLMEAGVTWIPSFLWRADKTWKGLRMEVPWVREKPSAVFRRHVRVTAQPIERAAPPSALATCLEQIGSDEVLLFATDFPHDHFDGDDVVPAAVPAALVAKMKHDNPLRTYPRLAVTP